MKRIYTPTDGPECWRQGLADPDKQWRRGYSARALAHCWEAADGFPGEITKMLDESPGGSLAGAEFLLAIPEHSVPLKGRGKASQNDLFVLARASSGELITIVVEGKVSEPFGPTVAEWLEPATDNKLLRLAYLQEQLGLPAVPGHIRYQLVHRTASAVIEAQRFGATLTGMIVHSFSQEHKWFADYLAFLDLFGTKAAPGQLVPVIEKDGLRLLCGWAVGDSSFLAA